MAATRRAPWASLLVALWVGVLSWGGDAFADPPRRGHGHHSRRGRHRHRRVNLAAYRATVRAWHDPARVPAPRFTNDGRMVLRLTAINTRRTAELTPARADGGFDDAARARVAEVFGDHRANETAGIDRRLIDLVYEVARHFRAGQVSVLSGYRAGTRRSNHGRGRAVDIVVPGVADEALAAYARTLGFVGVGVYPHGGFVHLDVRDRSYFWVDRSLPGRRSRRMHEVHGDEARRADEAARARGVTPYGGTEGAAADGAQGADDEDENGPEAAPGT